MRRALSHQPPRGERRAVEFAERDVVGDAHAADAGVLQRLLGQQRHLVAAHLARGVALIGLAARRGSRRLRRRAGRPALRPVARWPLPETPAMPTISPARTLERHVVHRDRAGVVERVEPVEFEPRPRRPRRLARGCTVSSSAPIMIRAMSSGVRSATRPAPASLPRRRIVTSSANAITSRNLCVIIRMVSSSSHHHVAQHAEHLVGLAGRQHRGRLVEDQKACASDRAA